MVLHPYSNIARYRAELDAAFLAYANEFRSTFPRGTRVRINHHRGSFEAIVEYQDPSQHRLRVRNTRTEKFSFAYPGMRVGIQDTDVPCVEKLKD